MAHRRLRASVLSVTVTGLLLFQAVYALPIVLADDPSAAPTLITSPIPATNPESTPGSAPTSQEPASQGPSPSATDAASPSAPVSSSLAPTPTATSVDRETELKPGATEIIAKRSASSQTYDNHDGTFTTILSSSPKFYQADGSTSWQPISVGFASGTKRDGLVGEVPTLTSDRAPASVSLFDLTSKDFVTVAQQGVSVGFALPMDKATAAKPTAPVVNGVSAVYLDFLPGADLRIIARAGGTKAFVILHGIPVDPTWTFRVDAPGLTLAPQEDGSISLLDGSGKAIGTNSASVRD